MDIKGDDGRGVYTVNTLDGNDELLDFLSLEGELSVVAFMPQGAYFKVVKDNEYDMVSHEDDEDKPINHVGYVVYPNDVPPSDIVDIRAL